MLTGVLALVFLVGVLGLVYMVLVSFPLESGYTEIALYEENQTAAKYPEHLDPGDMATVLVEIENREHRNMTYTLVVRTNESLQQTHLIRLRSDATWSNQVEIRRTSPAVTRVNFDLYTGRQPDQSDKPYRSTFIQFSERPNFMDHS